MLARALELFHDLIGEGGVDRKHNSLIEGVLEVGIKEIFDFGEVITLVSIFQKDANEVRKAKARILKRLDYYFKIFDRRSHLKKNLKTYCLKLRAFFECEIVS
jgi:hypothetical protein